MVIKPRFIDSPYFVGEPDNWHLLPGAPVEVVQEFEEFIKQQEKANNKGISL